MKTRIAAALMLALLLPSCAMGQILMDVKPDGGNQLVVFSAGRDVPEALGKNHSFDPVTMGVNMQIEARFEQEKAQTVSGRAGAVVYQDGSVYQDDQIASMWRLWQGEQADGMDGSSYDALTISLETGMEIYMDELFTDPQAAFSHMERIIEEDVLSSMSDYMEYSDLLPMPTDSYSIDQMGLTVYWDEDRYRYFSGEAGSVTFGWHEISGYIGEDSPVYALSRPQDVDVSKLRGAMALGMFDGVLSCRLGDELGSVKNIYRLSDPDYTPDALVYPLERMRGFAVEIPKYAETEEDQTPVSAVRAGCISYYGLTTGKTTVEELYSIFGKPVMTVLYDEDEAADALLEPGESLFFADMDRILQAHVDEDGVLSCLIIRKEIPQSLI